MGCRRPLAHRPSAARQFRSGPRPLSPTSPPCTHLTLGYSPKLVEKLSEKSLTHLRPSLTNSRTGPIRLLSPPYAGQTRSRSAARIPFQIVSVRSSESPGGAGDVVLGWAQTLLFRLVWPSYTGDIHSWSSAQTTFRTVSVKPYEKGYEGLLERSLRRRPAWPKGEHLMSLVRRLSLISFFVLSYALSGGVGPYTLRASVPSPSLRPDRSSPPSS